VTDQDEARAALVAATRAREEGWRQAILDALAVGIGPTEIARLAGITRGRVYQIRNEAGEEAQR
jgi:transposase-like protein